MTFDYDNNLCFVSSVVVFSNNITMLFNTTFDNHTGRLKSVKPFTVHYTSPDKFTFTDGALRITRDYDGYGRLADIRIFFGRSVVFKLQINYDQSGRIHQWRRRIGQSNSKAIEYIYDIDGHLTDVLVEGQTTWSYAYDPNGNIKKITENDKICHLTFDVGDKVLQVGEKVYKYDVDGMTILRGNDHTIFNSFGQLTTVISNGGRTIFKFMYNTHGDLTVQRDESGNITQYFYGNPNFPSRITHTYNHITGEASLIHYDANGVMIGMQRSDRTYYIASDPSETPLVIFDDGGHVVKERGYSPLGQCIFDSNPNFSFPFGFQGGVYVPQLQISFLNGRVYDTHIGRFLQPDYAGSFKKLSHVLDDPESVNLYRHRNMVNLRLQFFQRRPLFGILIFLSFFHCEALDINIALYIIRFSRETFCKHEIFKDKVTTSCIFLRFLIIISATSILKLMKN